MKRRIIFLGTCFVACVSLLVWRGSYKDSPSKNEEVQLRDAVSKITPEIVRLIKERYELGAFPDETGSHLRAGIQFDLGKKKWGYAPINKDACEIWWHGSDSALSTWGGKVRLQFTSDGCDLILLFNRSPWGRGKDYPLTFEADEMGSHLFQAVASINELVIKNGGKVPSRDGIQNSTNEHDKPAESIVP